MLNDFRLTLSGDLSDQRATGTITVDDYTGLIGDQSEGTITVDDYTKLVGVAASATITVDDYTKLVEAAATATVVIDDYTKLAEAAATGTIEITDYTQISGATFHVNGNDYIEGVHFTAETNNDTTATNLAAVIDVDVDFGAAAVGAVITITAAAAGTAGNAIATTTDAGGGVTISGATLSGGQDNATLTVDGTPLIQGTDFTAATSNDATATSLASAIDALGNVGAAAVTDTVTITASTAGSAGNSIAIAESDATAGGWTLSGANLIGGQDHAEITVDSVTYVQGTDFNAVTNNDTTATNIASAIDGGAQGAAAVGAVVTTTAAAVGVAGNSIDHTATYAAGGLTLSAATLENGWDQGEIVVGSDTLVQGTDFNAATNNDTTATNIASAIDGLSGVGAAAVGAVVTITNDNYGVAGNSKALTCNQATAVTLSGATLLGGVDQGTITIGSDTITNGTDFTAQTDDDTTATNIAAAIDLLASYTASADDNVITIYAVTPGAAANSDVLQTNKSSAVTLSGATLSGGEDYAYTRTVETDGANEIEATLNVTTLDGTSPTLDVTLQYSYDRGTTWFDNATAFTQAATTGSESKSWTNDINTLIRFKIDLGGTNPVAEGTIQGVVK